ncbi:MAG: YdeI/OmpD-associated family protein [Bacteroidota bacterium]
MRKDGIKTFYAKTVDNWRHWLASNHRKESSLWLIIYKKSSNVPSVTYREAVDEALCFGWIDSKPNKRDDQSYFQFFSRRNPKSNWSKINKEKVARLSAAGRMAPPGLEMIALAKASGTWTALDNVEKLVIPEDLQVSFRHYNNAEENFNKFPKSVKRGILEWILTAKKPETRNKRIEETAKLAADNIRANQYISKRA